jgi:hypothetical protein
MVGFRWCALEGVCVFGGDALVILELRMAGATRGMVAYRLSRRIRRLVNRFTTHQYFNHPTFKVNLSDVYLSSTAIMSRSQGYECCYPQ